ncbi:hypothetical protein CHLNCDRAFT_144480 [Chlorella variabilis]|uniref:OTU domain-containing protein n=1 Tax=Chlorella variabilis TaxID=554065 RepID=E1ZBI5_CHLVA|nr:hypothetical protein CHLNCDRAFT_144480 [Chlorella variabilis]EFN56859.1 hypothetical protein CHLNCDRAFT_144480 [Chlorella variabilis]|eukprot:XP_005848961.1 hypothetical protein CHLNCDRAFT_144480 [Chlorella variabilis]
MGCCCGEEDDEPFVEELRNQLSSIMPPLDVGWQADATVNVALTSQPSLGVFERRHSMSLGAATMPRREQQQPGNGQPHQLKWTDSRKLLEAAIGMEQMQPIPENTPPASNGWGWGQGQGPGLEAEEARLQERLFKLKLEHYVMEGDGSCQFRAVSFGLYGTQRHHTYVRRKAVQYMQQRRQDFEAFLGEDFGGYMRQMGRLGTWGDELTLRGICEALAVVVNVISSDRENWFLRYIPRTTRPQHEIFVTYIAPLHYNAVRRQNTGARLRQSFGRQGSQLARAVSSYQRRYGIPETPQHMMHAL